MGLKNIYYKFRSLSDFATELQRRKSDSSYIRDYTTLNNGACFHGNNRVQNYKIGKNSYVSFNSIIFNCTIGNYCSIGPNVVIGYGEHPTSFISTSPHIYLSEPLFGNELVDKILSNHFNIVEIKNDVWIGANVYIRNGIKIGNGAVIGSGAVVTKDVEDFTIVAGVPAKMIKRRFEENISKLINETVWWSLKEEELMKYKHVLSNPTMENLNWMLSSIKTVHGCRD